MGLERGDLRRGNLGGHRHAGSHRGRQGVAHGTVLEGAFAGVGVGVWWPPSAAALEGATMSNRAVPELSRFFGIIIRMFAEPGSPHHTAHFHAYYQGEVGIFSIEPV